MGVVRDAALAAMTRRVTHAEASAGFCLHTRRAVLALQGMPDGAQRCPPDPELRRGTQLPRLHGQKRCTYKCSPLSYPHHKDLFCLTVAIVLGALGPPSPWSPSDGNSAQTICVLQQLH